MTDPIQLLTSACDLAHKQVVAADQIPDASTPCAEFNTQQLVGHMISALELNSLLLGGPETSRSPFDPSSFPTDNLVDQFDQARTTLIDLASQPGKLDELVNHPASPEPIPAAMVLMFPTFDMYIHSWDLAQATGLDHEQPVELHEAVSAFCQQSFAGERSPEIVGAAVEAPADATPMQELAAFLGRAS